MHYSINMFILSCCFLPLALILLCIICIFAAKTTAFCNMFLNVIQSKYIHTQLKHDLSCIHTIVLQ